MERRSSVAAGFAALACAALLTACGEAPVKSGGPILGIKVEPKALSIPLQYQDSVEREFELGEVLKTYDDVAWIGTDAIQAAGYKAKPGVKGGFIVEPVSDDFNGVYQLVFVNELEHGPVAVAFAQVKHDTGMGHVLGARVLDPPEQLSDQAALMYRGLSTAKLSPDLKFCNAIYNTVVFPYVEQGKTEILVYFLMSTDKKGEVPIGGHTLVRVSADASTVLEVKPLAQSCMMGDGADDPKVAAQVFSDLALDTPSAAQVLLMWRYQKPVYMATRNSLLWAIDSKGIRLLAEGNEGLDQSRARSHDIPVWSAMFNGTKSTSWTQLGCTTDGQCAVDRGAVPQDAAMFMIAHPSGGQPKPAGGAASLRDRALALVQEVPHAGDWRPLAAGMVSALLTPNGAHYTIEGSEAHPRVKFLGGGDEKLARYVEQHWRKEMTNNDIVRMLEAYLTESGQKP